MTSTPKVSVGLGTILGLVTAGAAGVLAVVQAVEQGAPLLNGQNKPAAIIAFSAPVATALGRMFQAAHLPKVAAIADEVAQLPTLADELASPPVFAAPESAAVPDGAALAAPAAAAPAPAAAT